MCLLVLLKRESHFCFNTINYQVNMRTLDIANILEICDYIILLYSLSNRIELVNHRVV